MLPVIVMVCQETAHLANGQAQWDNGEWSMKRDTCSTCWPFQWKPSVWQALPDAEQENAYRRCLSQPVRLPAQNKNNQIDSFEEPSFQAERFKLPPQKVNFGSYFEVTGPRGSPQKLSNLKSACRKVERWHSPKMWNSHWEFGTLYRMLFIHTIHQKAKFYIIIASLRRRTDG